MDEKKNGQVEGATPDKVPQRAEFHLPRRNGRELTWDELMDLHSQFNKNRCEFPGEQLIRYWGQVIAWEPDGSAIRATGPDTRTLYEQIRSEGDDPNLYNYEYLPIV